MLPCLSGAGHLRGTRQTNTLCLSTLICSLTSTLLETALETNPPAPEYAGFWRRTAAYLLDTIVLSIVQGIILYFSGAYNRAPEDASILPGGISLLLSWLYFAGMESSAKQATLGKQVFEMKVTTEDFQRISFARATGRFFGKILSAIILLIGFIMVAFTAKKQGLHDKLAKTVVLHT